MNFLKKQVYKFRFIIIVFLVVMLILNNLTKFDFRLKIYFVDVGQGDCTVIITPKGKNIIIDGGEGNSGKYDYGKNVVLAYLLDRGITKLDYLIISHGDSDHIGGLFEVLENIKVNKIFIGVQSEWCAQLEDFIHIANQKRIEIILLSLGDKIEIEKDIEIEVLWPKRNNLILENALNNNSLVFKLKYNKFSMLFTGDIEETAEKELLNTNINLKSTILKVAHHGSRTSSVNQFLEKVNPQIALIGVGVNNTFGHPSNLVIERLKSLRF